MPSIHPSNKNEKDRKDRWQQNTEKKATASAKCRFDKSMNTQKPLPHSGVPSSDAVSCHLGHRWRRGCFAWQARHLVTLCSLWSPWPPSLVTVDAAAALRGRRGTWWLSVLCGLWSPWTPSLVALDAVDAAAALCGMRGAWWLSVVSGRLGRRLWSRTPLTPRLLCVGRRGTWWLSVVSGRLGRRLWSPDAWTSLNQSEPCLIQSEPCLNHVWTSLNGSEPLNQLWTVSEQVWSVEPCLNGVWTSLNQSEACLNQSEPVWTVSEPCSLNVSETSSERVWTVSERVWTVSEPCLNRV